MTGTKGDSDKGDFSLQFFVTSSWKQLLDFHGGLCSAPASRALRLQPGVGKTSSSFCSQTALKGHQELTLELWDVKHPLYPNRTHS